MNMRACLWAALALTAACALCAPVFAADFFAKDKDLTALPEFPDGAVRAHWTFIGYEECKVVGKPVNLAEDGEEEGYFATTADECGWMAASAPLWVVQRIDGALHVALADHGYSATVEQASRYGLRAISVSSILTGSYFDSYWEFNGNAYTRTREPKERMP